MKQFLVTATTVVALILPSLSMAEEAGYDEFDCSESTMMKTSPLRCVNCGIQKYNDKKNIDSTVSEKWLTLLALNAMRTAPAHLKDSDKTQYIQEAVAKSLRIYGSCSRYAERGVRTKGGDDMTLDQKIRLKDFLNKNTKPPAKEWEKIALEMGFNGEFLFFWDKESKADNAMNALFSGDPERPSEKVTDRSLHNRRNLFQKHLEKEFGEVLDSRGDRVANSQRKSLIADDGKDQGLRGCLREIYSKNKSQTLTKDKELYAVCDNVVSACKLPTIRKTPADTCYNDGMALWPEVEIITASKSAGVKYTPIAERNGKSVKDPGQPPPPPPGGFSRSGNR